MQETFYVVEGQVVLTLEGTPNRLGPGDYLHVEPGEAHFLDNNGEVPVKIVITAAPFTDGDKVALEE